MSAAPSTAEPRKPIRRQNEGPNSELMRALGGSDYTPIPPEQHEWQRRPEIEENTGLHRLWSWMVHNTLTWGHTTIEGEAKAYATRKDGTELHLDHAAKDLKMDPSNLNKVWKRGVRIGLWRNGTKQEGKRKLILCGKVVPPKEEPEDAEMVCTNHLHPALKSLPPYMLEKIVARPAHEVNEIGTWYGRLKEVRRLSESDSMAATRMVGDDIEDTGWQRWGIEKERQEHAKKNVLPEEVKARQKRLQPLLAEIRKLVEAIESEVSAPRAEGEIAALEGSLSQKSGPQPVPSNSVHTTSEFVQSSEGALYKENSQTVQAENPRPSLLPVDPSRSGEKRAGGRSRSSRETSSLSPLHEGREAVQLHAGELRKLPESTTEERESAVSLLAGIAQLQHKHPKKFVGDEVSPESRADMTTALKMVRTVGIAEVPAFVLEIEQRAIDRALGHQLSIALISEIAGDFARGASKRERVRREAEEQERKRQEFAAAAEKERERDEQLRVLTDATWEQLSVGDRMERLRVEDAELKADRHYDSVYRRNEAERHNQIEIRAKRKLRAELEKRGAK